MSDLKSTEMSTHVELADVPFWPCAECEERMTGGDA